MASAKELTDQGFNLYAKGEMDSAIALLKQAIATDPDYLEAHRTIAMCYGKKKMLDEAVAAANRMIEIDPNDNLAYVSLSIFLQRQGKIPEAEAAMAKATAVQSSAKK
ncbi:MAG: tetratricopeptide repeat protein [Deltaproteobacteria bacterium]|nr:tetratricopeptide repeat protein [Deltaproteobacteria bacterium]